MGKNTMTVQERVLTSLYLEQLRIIIENEETKKNRMEKRKEEKENE